MLNMAIKVENVCEWQLIAIEEHFNKYLTDCENTYYDDQVEMEAYNMTHCIFCGRKLKIKEGY